MSKGKFTEADIKRAVKGVIDGGAAVPCVEIWPDGRICVKSDVGQKPLIDLDDDPEVSRRLL